MIQNVFFQISVLTILLALATAFAWAEESPSSAYSFTLRTIADDVQDLAEYEGRIALFVNTASKCGFTSQYKSLDNLYKKYKDQGFVVLAFPSNDFNQEFETKAEIQEFCRLNYPVTFPLFAPIHVKGDNQHDLFRFLTTKGPDPEPISWNFHKILVDRNGQVVARFGSRDKPESRSMVRAVEKALKGK